MNHVMIDIETVDTEVSAGIVSIGAVIFNPQVGSGQWPLFFVRCNEKAESGQHYSSSAKTLRWWMQQDSLVRQQLDSYHNNEQVDIRESLILLRNFINKNDPQTVWANSPSFDLSILKRAMKLEGVSCPWEFWQERDFRTARDMCPLENPLSSKNSHHALDDAVNQAKDLVAMNKEQQWQL